MKYSTFTRPLLTSILCLASLLGAAGCATHRPGPEAKLAGNQGDKPELSDSSIDISYVLGHTHRRFLVRAKDAECLAQNFFDHQLLKEAAIDSRHYLDFYAKTTQYIQAPHRTPANQGEACRSPFIVTLRKGADTQIVKGCRNSDDGALSHLVRDGEFLLYSKK